MIVRRARAGSFGLIMLGFAAVSVAPSAGGVVHAVHAVHPIGHPSRVPTAVSTAAEAADPMPAATWVTSMRCWHSYGASCSPNTSGGGQGAHGGLSFRSP